MLSPRTISTPSGSSMTGSSGEKMRSTLSDRMTLVVWSNPINLPCGSKTDPRGAGREGTAGRSVLRSVVRICRSQSSGRQTYDDDSAILRDDEDLLCARRRGR